MSGTTDEVLGDRYRLIAPVGTGGMAVVWRARDEVLGRDVAVKLLAGQLATDPGSRERIRAEAQAIARLQHPNITAVHDYGEAGDQAAGRNGRRPYVVMELLDGELLSARLRTGPMSWRRATQICAQVAAGLAAAHDRGVVHRDIKPTNIMLTGAGAKILDFGVAGLAGSYDPDDDGPSGMVFGTPAYLAPERLSGGAVVSATDVYTVGLLLYRCLTDRLPWHADTPTQMIANHVYEPPHPLPAIPGLPSHIGDLVARCLSKDPDGRPPALEVAHVLAAATGIHVVLPDTDGSSTQEVYAPTGRMPGVEVTQRRTRPYHRKRRRVWLAALIAFAAAGASTGLAVWQPWAARAGCNVDFYVHEDQFEHHVFTARITVANVGNRTLKPWTVTFQLPGGQKIERIDGVASWLPAGGGVTMTGQESLPAGKAVTAGMNGEGGTPAPPRAFKLNGTACDDRIARLPIESNELPAVTGVIDAPKTADRPADNRQDPFGPPPGHGPGGPPPGGPPPGGPPRSGDGSPPPRSRRPRRCRV